MRRLADREGSRANPTPVPRAWPTHHGLDRLAVGPRDADAGPALRGRVPPRARQGRAEDAGRQAVPRQQAVAAIEVPAVERSLPRYGPWENRGLDDGPEDPCDESRGRGEHLRTHLDGCNAGWPRTARWTGDEV